MEKTDVSIPNEEHMPEESKKIIDQVTNDVLKKVEENNDEVQTTEKNDDEVVPSTTPKPTEEEENNIDTDLNLPDSASPGRANVPFKEVNENENEENATVSNGPESMNNKKRELDNEDEQIQEKILDNDERTTEQIKKLKTSDSIDVPVVEPKESEHIHAVNGTTITEV